MANMILFLKRVKRFLATKGWSGAKNYIERVSSKTDIFSFYGYIVDTIEIKFDEKAYNKHKNDEIKILNWIIP